MQSTTHSSLRRRASRLAAALLATGLAAGTFIAGTNQAAAGEHAHRVSTAMPAPELPAELAAVREALRKYDDPLVAVRDCYFSTFG